MQLTVLSLVAVAGALAAPRAPRALGEPRASASGNVSARAILAARQASDGRRLYLKNCRTCHGATGNPSSENREKYPKIRTLNDAAFLAKLSDDSLLTVLKKGKGTDMKSWSDKLSEPEMRAVIAYVRTLVTKKP